MKFQIITISVLASIAALVAATPFDFSLCQAHCEKGYYECSKHRERVLLTPLSQETFIGFFRDFGQELKAMANSLTYTGRCLADSAKCMKDCVPTMVSRAPQGEDRPWSSLDEKYKAIVGPRPGGLWGQIPVPEDL